MLERRKGERYALPEIYSEYITLKVRKASGDFEDAELFNFSPGGVRLKSRQELLVHSTIECLISAPKSLSKEIPFTGKIKYCTLEESGKGYLIGAEIIDTSDKV